MNKIKSFWCVGFYSAKVLSNSAHKLLSSQLKHFKLTQDHTYLKLILNFPDEQYSSAIHKMNIIEIVADEIDHHPEWTLNKNQLLINLTTHSCQGKVSVKDYILASWIQKIWDQQLLEQRLINDWNNRKINLEELK